MHPIEKDLGIFLVNSLLNSIKYLHPDSLQVVVSLKSVSVAREHIPPIHLRVLVFNPSPQVALQLEYSDHSEYTGIFS